MPGFGRSDPFAGRPEGAGTVDRRIPRQRHLSRFGQLVAPAGCIQVNLGDIDGDLPASRHGETASGNCRKQCSDRFGATASQVRQLGPVRVKLSCRKLVNRQHNVHSRGLRENFSLMPQPPVNGRAGNCRLSLDLTASRHHDSVIPDFDET